MLKIFFHVSIWKTTIVEVYTKLLLGKRPPWEKGADRFKDDLMLRLLECALAKGLDEILPQIARDRLIAERAEGPEFGCKLFFAIHDHRASGILLY